jgi:hypothetical protein
MIDLCDIPWNARFLFIFAIRAFAGVWRRGVWSPVSSSPYGSSSVISAMNDDKATKSQFTIGGMYAFCSPQQSLSRKLNWNHGSLIWFGPFSCHSERAESVRIGPDLVSPQCVSTNFLYEWASLTEIQQYLFLWLRIRQCTDSHTIIEAEKAWANPSMLPKPGLRIWEGESWDRFSYEKTSFAWTMSISPTPAEANGWFSRLCRSISRPPADVNQQFRCKQGTSRIDLEADKDRSCPASRAAAITAGLCGTGPSKSVDYRYVWRFRLWCPNWNSLRESEKRDANRKSLAPGATVRATTLRPGQNTHLRGTGG